MTCQLRRLTAQSLGFLKVKYLDYLRQLFIISGLMLQMVLVLPTAMKLHKNIYGPLYNWYTGADERTLCPSGWHIPSNDEFLELRDYLGGLSIAGAKMKETESGLWNFPNTGADNSSGFTALPGSDRDRGELKIKIQY